MLAVQASFACVLVAIVARLVMRPRPLVWVPAARATRIARRQHAQRVRLGRQCSDVACALVLAVLLFPMLMQCWAVMRLGVLVRVPLMRGVGAVAPTVLTCCVGCLAMLFQVLADWVVVASAVGASVVAHHPVAAFAACCVAVVRTGISLMRPGVQRGVDGRCSMQGVRAARDGAEHVVQSARLVCSVLSAVAGFFAICSATEGSKSAAGSQPLSRKQRRRAHRLMQRRRRIFRQHAQRLRRVHKRLLQRRGLLWPAVHGGTRIRSAELRRKARKEQRRVQRVRARGSTCLPREGGAQHTPNAAAASAGSVVAFLVSCLFACVIGYYLVMTSTASVGSGLAAAVLGVQVFVFGGVLSRKPADADEPSSSKRKRAAAQAFAAAAADRHRKHMDAERAWARFRAITLLRRRLQQAHQQAQRRQSRKCRRHTCWQQKWAHTKQVRPHSVGCKLWSLTDTLLFCVLLGLLWLPQVHAAPGGSTSADDHMPCCAAAGVVSGVVGLAQACLPARVRDASARCGVLTFAMASTTLCIVCISVVRICDDEVLIAAAAIKCQAGRAEAMLNSAGATVQPCVACQHCSYGQAG